jgi:CheY-like chemotaxis protein
MMKILIVDDSELDRRLLVRILQKAEIKNEILQATDGEQGL